MIEFSPYYPATAEPVEQSLNPDNINELDVTDDEYEDPEDKALREEIRSREDLWFLK